MSEQRETARIPAWNIWDRHDDPGGRRRREERANAGAGSGAGVAGSGAGGERPGAGSGAGVAGSGAAGERPGAGSGAAGAGEEDETIPEDVCRDVFMSFFADKGMHSHLIESFDDMFRVTLPHMIAEFGRIIICSEKTQTLHLITILPPTEIRKPQKREKMGYVSDLSIREARDRGLTYEAAVITDIVHEIYTPKPGTPPIILPRKAGAATDGSAAGAGGGGAGAGAGAGGAGAGGSAPSMLSESSPPAISTIRPLPGLSPEADPLVGLEPTTQMLLRYAGMMAETNSGMNTSPLLNGVLSATAQWTMDELPTSRTFSSLEDMEKPDPSHFAMVSRTISKDVKLFSLPVMVGSDRCHTRSEAPSPADSWNRAEGYCIVNGMEKIFQPQLNPITNHVVVRLPSMKHEVQSCFAEMRCRHWSKIRSTATLYATITSSYGGNGMVLGHIKVPWIERPIPLFAFCRMIGFRTVEGLARVISCRGSCGEEGLDEHTFVDSPPDRFELWLRSMLRNRGKDDPDFEAMSTDEVMLWVGDMCIRKKTPTTLAAALAANSTTRATAASASAATTSTTTTGPAAAGSTSTTHQFGFTPAEAASARKYVQHILSNEFMPQVGLDTTELTLRNKRTLLAFMVWKVCRVARHEMPPDDRDHFGNQMIETPGRLVISLFRQLYRSALIKRTIKLFKSHADSGRHFSPADCIPSRKLTNDMGYAMSTGSWGVQKGGSAVKGITQNFKRINPQASISNLRSMKKPGELKDMAPRLLGIYDWGIACPSETSEGENCGLLKHLSSHAYICQGRPTRHLVETVLLLLGDRFVRVSSFEPIFEDGGAAEGQW